jgi:hypothetical protein
MNAEKGKQLPKPIKDFVKYSNISIMLFIFAQLLGLTVLIPIVKNYIDLLNQALAGNYEITSIFPKSDELSFLANLISGLSISGTAGWWLPIAISARRLKYPYSNRAFNFLNIFGVLEIVTYVFALKSLVLDGGNIAGFIGTTLALVFSLPLFIFANSAPVRKWSVRYIPPAPEI